MIKYLLCFVLIMICHGAKAFKNVEDTTPPPPPYYQTIVERYDLEQGAPEKQETVVFQTIDDFMYAHPRAILNTDPERLASMFNRYVLNAHQFAHICVDGGGNLIALLNNPENFPMEKRLPLIASLGKHICTQEVIHAFGNETILYFADFITAKISDARVQEVLTTRDKGWGLAMHFLPIPTGNAEKPFDTPKQFEEMTALEFYQTKGFFDAQFDFRHKDRLLAMVNTFLADNVIINFDVTSIYVSLMIEGSYNPFAPHYTQDQLDAIVRIHLKKWANIETPADQNPREFLRTQQETFLKDQMDQARENQTQYQELVKNIKDIEDKGGVTPVLQALYQQKRMYGYGMLFNFTQKESLSRLLSALKIVETNPQNVVGYHILQGTLDTASFLHSYFKQSHDKFKTMFETSIEALSKNPFPKPFLQNPQ